ncbi:MAG: cytochrome b/b6 domain-containing protein [Methylococcaceae bacterium]
MKTTITVWDLPLRLFHWLLVLAVIGAYVTGKLGGNLTDWHDRLGGFILALLVFRFIWGFVGTTHARFINFMPNFSKLTAYFNGDWQGVGHNPAGALAVIALLMTLLFLVITGLFANDDIAFEGAWFHLISKELSDKLSNWHSLAFDVLLGLVVSHLAALIFYQVVKKTNLVLPMLTGKKQLPDNFTFSSTVPVKTSHFIFTLLAATLIVWGVWHIG